MVYFVIVDINRDNLVTDYAQGSIRAHYEELGERLLQFEGVLPATIKRFTTKVTVNPVDGTSIVIVVPQPQMLPIHHLREAIFNTHEQLIQWTMGIETAAATQLDSARQKAHDYIAHAHTGVFLTVRNTAYTIAQRITFCNLTAQGALDITSPTVFFQQSKNLPLPTTPIVWVDISTGVRLPLATAVATSAMGIGNLSSEESEALANDYTPDASWVNNLAA